MVFAHVPFDYLYLSAQARLSYQLSRSFGYLSFQHLIPVFRYPHKVILDVIQRMRSASILRHCIILATPLKLFRLKAKDSTGRLDIEAQEHRFYAAYFLTLSLGLRLGEVRGLQWADISASTLHVQRTLSVDRAVPKFGPPKTKKGDRLLPIPSDTLSILNSHKQAQESTRVKAGKGWQDYDLIFTTGRGTPPSRIRLVEPFEKLSSRAEISRIRFHDLRHTAASLWIASGMDVATVSARLGHADINTTLRIYGHAFRSRLEQSSRTMKELLDSV